jgi:hypothetical protein
VTLAARCTTIVIVLLALVACRPAQVRSVLTDAQAMAIAESALRAFNDGDYAGWSRDWSSTMKASIPEPAFLAFREGAMAGYGRYVAVERLELVPGARRGYVRWNATALFEGGRLRFGFAFASDGRLVEGVFPEPVQ